MIEDVLNERQKTHGDYADHARITQELKYVMRLHDYHDLSDCQKETLEMIAHKIGRILAGDPNHVDHWTDIAGYATLIERQLSS